MAAGQPLSRLALAAGSVADDVGYVGLTDISGGARPEAAAIVRALFARRQGPAMTMLAAEQRLSAQAADQHFTRIRALSTRVLGPG